MRVPTVGERQGGEGESGGEAKGEKEERLSPCRKTIQKASEGIGRHRNDSEGLATTRKDSEGLTCKKTRCVQPAPSS